MKKQLLLISFFLFMVVAAMAQSFEFRYHGNSVADGATVTIAAEEDDFGELSCETNLASNPADGLMLKLLSGTSADFSATMEIEYNTLNASTVQWCMGGACMPFNNVSKLNKNFTVNDAELVQFDAYDIKTTGYLLAKLAVRRALESQTIYIQFTNGESAGIGTMLNNEKAPKDNVVFDLQGRRVDQPTKGLYIVGGRKIIVK